MKQLWAYLCVIGVWIGGVASAQLPQIEDYSGDVWSRPALTGDWGGLRNTLAKNGINLDVDLVQGRARVSIPGDRSGITTAYAIPMAGTPSTDLNVDTGKLGLWPGGFLSIMGESQFGSYLKGNETGALLPPNAAALYPIPFDERPRSPVSSSPNFWPSGSASTWASSTPSAAMRMPLPTTGRRNL